MEAAQQPPSTSEPSTSGQQSPEQPPADPLPSDGPDDRPEDVRLREFFKAFEIGQKVWAMNKGKWYHAKVLQRGQGNHPENAAAIIPTYMIHYSGWPDKWDEWIMADSLAAMSAENDAEVARQNARFNESHAKKDTKKPGTKLAKNGNEKAVRKEPRQLLATTVRISPKNIVMEEKDGARRRVPAARFSPSLHSQEGFLSYSKSKRSDKVLLSIPEPAATEGAELNGGSNRVGKTSAAPRPPGQVEFPSGNRKRARSTAADDGSASKKNGNRLRTAADARNSTDKQIFQKSNGNAPAISRRPPAGSAQGSISRKETAGFEESNRLQLGRGEMTGVKKRDNYISWEEYFMAVSFLSAQRSKDPSSQVGACIVSEEQKIVGIGYNGMPNGCSDDELPWARNAASLLDTKYPYVCHAEMNAIMNKNSASVKDCTMYVALFPCNECAKLCIQSGIKEIVYISDKYREKDEFIASRRLFNMAGVKLRQFIPRERQVVLDFTAIDPLLFGASG
ncbi:Deoxycytidylate deaminase [Hypsibius exemplaris]|uniref:Probable deoxycytidylate deaminase n=1 Tax=Hypsibius exemplaris TaxID=2072580 RepID=A0A9X6RLK8_HYPEX|nr:Deoxycytidylate deaminase [Hypsibius exemplaris]